MLLGTLWVLAQGPAGDGASGDFALQVVGPDGPLYKGTVTVSDATPLKLLLAAAEAWGFDVELDSFSGFGECGEYVRSIAGHEASGASGWVYEVEGPDGWTRPAWSSSCQPLEESQPVRWLWVDHE